MATKRSNKSTNVLIKNADKLKATTKNVNEKALQLTDGLVEETLAIGEQWQGLFAKVLQDGVKLLGKQQNLVFSTLESIKGQYSSDRIRLKKVLGWGKEKADQKVEAVKEVKKLTIKTKKVAVKKARTTAKRVKAVAKPKLIVKDDLKAIKGIGPKIESLLKDAGITNYSELTKAKVALIKEVLAAAGPRYTKYNPGDWKKQARVLAAKK